MSWWKEVVTDPRFSRIRLMANANRRYLSGIEESPHGQNVADGYRQGFSHYSEILETMPDNHQRLTEALSKGGFVSVQHPDLTDA